MELWNRGAGESGRIMVSFSCGRCQGVFKKPKVQQHMTQCRSQLVSCLDCGVDFSFDAVSSHTSCVTEQEKYEKAGRSNGREQANTTAFCATCALILNGAVHAEQHYSSKKHKSAERRKSSTSTSKQTTSASPKQNTSQKPRTSEDAPDQRWMHERIRKYVKKQKKADKDSVALSALHDKLQKRSKKIGKNVSYDKMLESLGAYNGVEKKHKVIVTGERVNF